VRTAVQAVGLSWRVSDQLHEQVLCVGQAYQCMLQGASPADVKAQLTASASQHLIQDDPAMADSLNGSVPYLINISSTPNLLLYSMLRDQVCLLLIVVSYQYCTEGCANMLDHQ